MDGMKLFMCSLLLKHSTLSPAFFMNLFKARIDTFFFPIFYQKELRKNRGKSCAVVILWSMSLALNRMAVFTTGVWKKSFPYKLRIYGNKKKIN